MGVFVYWSNKRKMYGNDGRQSLIYIWKSPELEGRLSDFPNHSMNSLRSDSISYFVAQIAFLQPETQY